MTKGLAIILLLLVSSIAVLGQVSKCPAANAVDIRQDSITISSSGQVQLQNGQDIQCYNYTFATPFANVPGVAIAVNNLQSAYSQNLFFSIKAVNSDSNAVIPFIVRTQWGYTQWSRITFSFLAESSSQIEAGYYQIDTGSLSNCYSGKDIIAFLPFVNQNINAVNALTFLNGFEISSISVNSSYLTPYEVQILSSAVTNQGISLIISSTSATQIHSIFVSYVAYDSSIQNLVGGSYSYTQYNAVSSLSFLTPIGVTNNNVAFHGFNSFIIRNNRQSFSLSGALDKNSNLVFTTSSLFFYLGYSYFYLIGGPCGQCVGYSINYNGNCLASCPPNSYQNGATCTTCQVGQIWNGSACVARCTNGQLWDNTALKCVCPAGQNWNGNACITCNGGQIWNAQSNQCVCAANSNWNGFVCISCSTGLVWNVQTLSCSCPSGSQWNGLTCIVCPAGQTFNSATNACACPTGSNWNGKNCVICSNGQIWNSQSNSCGCASGSIFFNGKCTVIPSCTNGQVLNTNTYTCVCAPGANWNGNACITCNNGQIWNSQTNTCQCPQGFNWNGYSCVQCQNGQTWNAQTNACSCPSGQNWNGFSCVTCVNGQSWSSSVNACVCPQGLNWNGASCIACASGSNWNGFSCITCSTGQVWNSALNVCQCPAGQQWNGTNCITPCPTGMTNVNGVCTCPAGTYLLNGACAKQPTCQAGQTWNGLQCVSISCPPGTSWNGTICTTQATVVCPAGTYYDGTKCTTNTTVCPSGTTWNGVSCVASGNCPNGTYLNGTQCVAISQLCPAGLTWQNNQCVSTNNQCPTGSYHNGVSCTPLQPCTNGRVWNSTVSQCVCATGTYWNGNICIQCSGGQTYQANVGCFCPNGTFYNGSQCTTIQPNQCASVANSVWNGNACMCNPGYSVIGMQCVCQGLAVSSSYCSRCYNKPNSTWSNGVCQCNAGFNDVQGVCRPASTPNPTNPTNPTVPTNSTATPKCNVATYWDNQQLRCLPCSSGCLSCSSCYSCTQCQPQFYMDYASNLCLEVCGDGRRFTLGCDDGNNVNGDGCSADCNVEVGYTCVGGSPNSKDTCTKTLPRALSFTSTGQSHIWGKIVLNVQANYLPLTLIQSAADCNNKCNDVLSVKIVSGDSSAVSIVASYIPTTSFSFSVEIDFGKEPIGLFSVQIGINPNLVQKYFSGIDTSRTLSVNVNPAYLALYKVEDTDNLDI